jgi:hypothetical protein
VGLAWGFFIASVIAIIPQVQMLAWRGIGPARFHGDFEITIFGANVPVAVTTSVVMVAAWDAGHSVFYAPGWVPEAIAHLLAQGF